MGVGSAPFDVADDEQVRVDLRLLATTDLHFHMWPTGSARGWGDRGEGLVAAVNTISTLTSNTPNSMLFDNGDLLQGTALADLVARQLMQGGLATSPLHAVLRSIGYDAVSIGNHDLNYGLDYLVRTAVSAPIPWLCANLFRIDRRGQRRQVLPGHCVLDRVFEDTAGGEQRIRVGVIGILPPQSADWDRHILGPDVRTTDMVEAAARARDDALNDGADIVVALCHAGLDPDPGDLPDENVANQVAALHGIDAVVAGHTHKLFPDASFAGRDHIDHRLGHVNGTPLVMPGSHGSHVGVIDLRLARRNGRWRPVAGHGRLVATTHRSLGHGEAALLPLRSAYLKVLGESQQEVCESEGPLFSHLSLIGTDPIGRLVGEALARYAAAEQLPAEWRDAPILAATSPIMAGGRAGAGNYLAIPPGTLRRGHLSEIYPFPNTACLIGITGDIVRRWLEESALFYNAVGPAATGGPGDRLFETDDAPYLFDTIWGLRYAIDPSRTGDRIRRLRMPDGRPVRPDDRFVMVTNSYRAAGSGQFTMATEGEMLRVGQVSVQSILHVHLAELGSFSPDYRPAFDIELQGGGRVRFPTGSDSLGARILAEGRSLTESGETRDGFDMLTLQL